MKKENNIIKRIGSKITDIKYFNHLLPLDDIDIVVEPFGGVFAVIKYYKQLYNDRYLFHINDLDEELYYIYNHPDEYIDINNQLIETSKQEQFRFNEKYTNQHFKDYVKTLQINEHMKKYIVNNHFVRGNVFKAPLISNESNEYQLLKQSIITNKDYKNILEEYKDNEKAFLFIDPPYLFSNDKAYAPQVEDEDMTEIIVFLLEYLKTCKCKVMIIIYKLKILIILFQLHIKS